MELFPSVVEDADVDDADVDDTADSDSGIVTLHFVVKDKDDRDFDEFRVKSFGEATIRETLEPFCKEHNCTTDDMDIIWPNDLDDTEPSMSLPARTLQGNIVCLRLRDTFSNRINSDVIPHEDVQSVYNMEFPSQQQSLPNIVVKSSKKKLKIYITTFQQIGNNNKIILNSQCNECSNKMDATLSSNNVETDGRTSTDFSEDPYSYSDYKTFDPYVVADNASFKTATLSKGQITTGQKEAPCGTAYSTTIHRVSPETVESEKHTDPSRDDGGYIDCVQQERGEVDYENIPPIQCLRRHSHYDAIPNHIIRAAMGTRGFWNLQSHKQLYKTLKQLKERYGNKDGRYIIWQSGHKRLVASVTFNGELKHFQILWTGREFKVYDRGIVAQDLQSLLTELKSQPLYLNNMVDEVILQSPVAFKQSSSHYYYDIEDCQDFYEAMNLEVTSL